MTFSPKITHTFPNGAVNVELTLTFSTGGPLVAEDIAEKMLEELLRLAGTRCVPAIPLTPEERGENDDSPEEREMTRQGVGDFGDDHELLNGASDARKATCSCGETFSTTTEGVQHRTTEEERNRIARAAADLTVSAA